MNNRQRLHAIMNYENYDRMPVVHFGFWKETLQKWRDEKILTEEDLKGPENKICDRLGFDFGWGGDFGTNNGLWPCFEQKVVEELPDGSRKIWNGDGVIVLEFPGMVSIPAEIDHILKDRKSWEEYFLPKLQFSKERVNFEALETLKKDNDKTENPRGIHLGSMIGVIRNWLGVEGLSYLWGDDPELFDEIINTHAELTYKCLELALSAGVEFDYGNFWEDICFKNGPLVVPHIFDEKCGPHYKKITELLKKHDINIVSLDCDGCIDALVPTWSNNGVNTMFPIEVGTWNASIKPWREKYGKALHGVGGMNKNVFAEDYKAIDAEIERLKPLIELGGYIPCPDHRIPPDAKWDNVCYYCEKLRQVQI